MSPQFSRELRHLQNQLQKHADAISNAAQLMLQSREANSRFWRFDVEKVLQGARAIYRLSTESLRPALYDDGRPTVENEIFVIRHELRGLLNNVFGRCDLISNLVQGDETLSKELSFIVDRVKKCVEALDQQRDVVSTGASAPGGSESSSWVVPMIPVTQRSMTPARILVADDDADSRELLGRLLSRMGCEVVFAETGQEALQRVAETAFEIILLDLVMPAPNGLEVLEKLRREDRLRHTFVIIISGLDDAANVNLAIRLGAVEVLARPIDFNRLRARVETCLDRLRVQADREDERAAEIAQARILLETFSPPRNATYGPLRVQGFLEQASEMGVGDFFFHYPLNSGAILAGVGDVTGKGLPAALDMVRFVTLIQHTVENCDPANFANWLIELNNTLHGLMRHGDNAAALTILLFDLEHRRVQLTSFAQHPPLSRDYVTGIWRPVNCPRNGFFAQREFRELSIGTVSLATGSHWLIHSDGITEATLVSGGAVQQEGLIKLLHQSNDWTNYKLNTLVDFWKSSLQTPGEDDATLLLIQNETPPPPLDFSGLITPQKIGEAHEFFERWCGFVGLDTKDTIPLVVGCDEILSNILRHAYEPNLPPGPFSCAAVVEPNLLRFIIRHGGRGISKSEAEVPISRREEGGLGLKLIRHVFSRVHFSPGDAAAGAEIVLEKDLV